MHPLYTCIYDYTTYTPNIPLNTSKHPIYHPVYSLNNLLNRYVALWTPVEVAFMQTSAEINGLFWLNRFVDLVFLWDIIISFRIQYPRPNGKGWIADKVSIVVT